MQGVFFSMQKLSLGILSLFLVLAFTSPSFANEGYGKGSMHSSSWRNVTMSESQEADYFDCLSKRNDVYIDFLNSEVAAGRLDRQVADAKIILMNENLKKLKEGRFENRLLTDEEIQAKENLQQKLNELEIEYIEKSIENGHISKERGEYMIQRLKDKNNYHKNGYGHYGHRLCSY